MTQKGLRNLYNACRDYGIIAYGQFPSWEQVKKAHKSNRLHATDYKHAGSIRISGVKHQQCCVMFVIED